MLRRTEYWILTSCQRAQRQLGAEHDQFPCGPTGTSSGDCQRDGNEHGLNRSRTTQSLQNRPSGHLARWATSWSTEEMLVERRQKSGRRPCPGQNCPRRDSRRKDRKRTSAESEIPPTTYSVEGLN